MRAFFSLERSARHQASPSVPTRSFCESILFVRLEALRGSERRVRLEALRGSERRVVRIVGMVGLTLDETPCSLQQWPTQPKGATISCYQIQQTTNISGD